MRSGADKTAERRQERQRVTKNPLFMRVLWLQSFSAATNLSTVVLNYGCHFSGSACASQPRAVAGFRPSRVCKSDLANDGALVAKAGVRPVNKGNGKGNGHTTAISWTFCRFPALSPAPRGVR